MSESFEIEIVNNRNMFGAAFAESLANDGFLSILILANWGECGYQSTRINHKRLKITILRKFLDLYFIFSSERDTF